MVENDRLRAERDYARAEARTLGQRVQEAEAELALLKDGRDGWAQYTEEVATNAALRAELAEVERNNALLVRALCSDQDPEMTFPEFQRHILRVIEGEQS